MPLENTRQEKRGGVSDIEEDVTDWKKKIEDEVWG